MLRVDGVWPPTRRGSAVRVPRNINSLMKSCEVHVNSPTRCCKKSTSLLRRLVAISLAMIICSISFTTTVSASQSKDVSELLEPEKWDGDGWLTAIIGPERLALGDEFGCYGIPDLDAREEFAVFSACRDYLTARTRASRWGDAPISFGLTKGLLTSDATEAAVSAGFRIVGPGVVPTGSNLSVVAVDAGSLEKNIADITSIEAAFEEAGSDGLASITWRARIEDLNVRLDRDVVGWLEQQEIWFTTWGEWLTHAEASRRITAVNNATNNTGFYAPVAFGDDAWFTLGSVMITPENNTTVIGNIVYRNGTDVPLLNSSTRHLEVGWRNLSNGSAVVTVAPGSTFFIVLSNGFDGSINTSNDQTFSHTPVHFNALQYALAIAGTHTTDLMEWASGFAESPLRFTWLVQPDRIAGLDWRLVAIAGVTLVITVATMHRLVTRDRDGLDEYAALERRFEQEANRDGISNMSKSALSEE